MCNFEQETVLICSHVGLSLLGHPHEPRQPQPQGPQKVIDRYNMEIALRTIFAKISLTC